MIVLGFREEFIDMVRLLLTNISACTKINGTLIIFFLIIRRVKQAYLLALYLFLIVEEVINIIITWEVANRAI